MRGFNRLMIAAVVLAGCGFGLKASAATLGYWRFEECPPDSVRDWSGNGHGGAWWYGAACGSDLPVNPVPLTGQLNAGSLDLHSNGAVLVPDAANLRPAHSLTIEGWIKPEAPNPWVMVGKQWLHQCCRNSFQIELHPQVTDQLTFTLYDTDGAGHAVVVGTGIPVGRWFHVAGTWDGSKMRVYVDGMVRDSTTFVGEVVYDDHPILIGADDDAGDGQPHCCWFHGSIDEVRISDEALSPERFLRANLPTAARGSSWGKIKTTYR